VRRWRPARRLPSPNQESLELSPWYGVVCSSRCAHQITHSAKHKSDLSTNRVLHVSSLTRYRPALVLRLVAVIPSPIDGIFGYRTPYGGQDHLWEAMHVDTIDIDCLSPAPLPQRLISS
jgi:hypothetical protein